MLGSGDECLEICRQEAGGEELGARGDGEVEADGVPGPWVDSELGVEAGLIEAEGGGIDVRKADICVIEADVILLGLSDGAGGQGKESGSGAGEEGEAEFHHGGRKTFRDEKVMANLTDG